MAVKLYVKNSEIHGKGLFTESVIQKNTCILIVADLKRHHYGQEWLTKEATLINHQKNCNTYLKRHGDKVYLYSSREIEIDEELTSDYSVLPPPFKNNTEGFVELGSEESEEQI